MEFYIETGVENMQIPVVVELLHTTAWAKERSAETIEKSMRNSDCYGAFLKENDQQIGFSRVVTDDATFFWLTDVIVDEKYRGNGAGKMMMEAIRNQEKYIPMHGVLITRDAQGLYERYGFIVPEENNYMRKPNGA